MTELLVDENFNEDIIDGLTRRDASLEFTSVRSGPDCQRLAHAGRLRRE